MDDIIGLLINVFLSIIFFFYRFCIPFVFYDDDSISPFFLSITISQTGLGYVNSLWKCQGRK